MNITELQKRYMKDPPQVQLGGIASDLARLSNLCKHDDIDQSMFRNVLFEVKLFTEWAVGSLHLDVQKKILLLQRFLARLDKNIEVAPKKMNKSIKKWSDAVIDISGLKG